MRDIPAATTRLQELKQLGVSIAIDDFGGSGYAHQANLQQMPLDSLRVDRSSLAATEDESYRNWLLEAILVVGRDLSLTVVATGIETAEQMAALQAIGCTMAQGGLLGEAVSVEAVSSLFGVGLPAVEAGAGAGVGRAAECALVQQVALVRRRRRNGRGHGRGGQGRTPRRFNCRCGLPEPVFLSSSGSSVVVVEQ